MGRKFTYGELRKYEDLMQQLPDYRDSEADYEEKIMRSKKRKRKYKNYAKKKKRNVNDLTDWEAR